MISKNYLTGMMAALVSCGLDEETDGYYVNELLTELVSDEDYNSLLPDEDFDKNVSWLRTCVRKRVGEEKWSSVSQIVDRVVKDARERVVQKRAEMMRGVTNWKGAKWLEKTRGFVVETSRKHAEQMRDCPVNEREKRLRELLKQFSDYPDIIRLKARAYASKVHHRACFCS